MKCLYCGKELGEKNTNQGWHQHCVRDFFGTNELPSIEIDDKHLQSLANKTVDKGITVTGVQKKLSLHLSKEKNVRLTIVDYPAGYILKPQSNDFSHLPEYEYVTMQMAKIAKINVVPFSLMQSKDQYGYITKRIDRDIQDDAVNMYAMEDFCQLSNRLTEDKYKGSYERCAKIIQKYSSLPGYDLSELYMRLVFCFITGNSDMHLKNFSLIEQKPGNRRFALSKAYDFLPVNIIMPSDTEEMALTLHGKKRNLRRGDFIKFAKHIGLSTHIAENLIQAITKKENQYVNAIKESYLIDAEKKKYVTLLKERIQRLKGES